MAASFPFRCRCRFEPGADVHIDDEVALRDSRNELLAGLIHRRRYQQCDMDEVAECVFGTNDLRHPFVAEMHRWGRFNVSGTLRVTQLPVHYDFPNCG